MISSTEIGGKDIVVQVDAENVDKLVKELKDKDYEVLVRKR